MILKRVSYFKDYMKCTSHQFNKLVKIVGPLISKSEMSCRKAVSPGEQLGITLSQV